MSDTNSNRPISPEAVAGKLAAARNFEHPQITEQITAEPRLVEMLLYLQFVSQPENYAGGLRKFTADFIGESLDMIGTPAMRAIGERKLSREQAREIYLELPGWAKSAVGGYDDGALHAFTLADLGRFHSSLADDREKSEEEWCENLARVETLLSGASWELFFEPCLREARDSLSTYFRQLCELGPVAFRRSGVLGVGEAGCMAPWYFSAVAEAVLRWIDRRKATISATIAETEITRTVFKWLGKARSTSRAVLISGNSRFGKTEALRTWCAMNPGLARLVNTPASNSEADLLREVAKALGLEVGPAISAGRLRDRIDYVLSHTRLMLCFDESHLIFPLTFTRNTAPARLNWVRRSVMDAGLPCIFCSTPQSYNSAQKRYVKTTGYAIEQFTGRLLKTVELPEELSREDLLAVARIHFPKLAAQYLHYVVEKTVATERNYVSDLEKIATLARDNAQEAGRTVPTLADIKSALADVLPQIPRGVEVEAKEPVTPTAQRSIARSVQRPCMPLSRAVKPSAEADLSATGGRLTFGAKNPADLIHADGD